MFDKRAIGVWLSHDKRMNAFYPVKVCYNLHREREGM